MSYALAGFGNTVFEVLYASVANGINVKHKLEEDGAQSSFLIYSKS